MNTYKIIQYCKCFLYPRAFTVYSIFKQTDLSSSGPIIKRVRSSQASLVTEVREGTNLRSGRGTALKGQICCRSPHLAAELKDTF